MPLAVISYIACRICILLKSQWIFVVYNWLHEAFRQSFKAFSLVLKDLLALLITKLLRTIWGLPMYTWCALSSHLIFQTFWPFTGLSLQEVVLAHNAIFISQRRTLWYLKVSAPWTFDRMFVVLMYRRLVTSIINFVLFLAAVVKRVQWLTLLKWEQVEGRVLLFYASRAPWIATAIALTLIATILTASFALKRATMWSRSWLLTTLTTNCSLKRVHRHWL